MTAQLPVPCYGNIAHIMMPSQTLILVLMARGVQQLVLVKHRQTVDLSQYSAKHVAVMILQGVPGFTVDWITGSRLRFFMVLWQMLG
jgi:hypothetical protein